MMMRMMKSAMCFSPEWMWSMTGCRGRSQRVPAEMCAGSAAPGTSLLETAAAAGSFGTLLKALDAAGLKRVLEGEGPITVFAPADSAFAAVPKGTLDELLKPENRERLAGILKFRTAPGRIMSTELSRLAAVRTFEGRDIAVRTQGGAALLGDALVVKADIQCSNGVIHVIDRVMIPS